MPNFGTRNRYEVIVCAHSFKSFTVEADSKEDAQDFVESILDNTDIISFGPADVEDYEVMVTGSDEELPFV